MEHKVFFSSRVEASKQEAKRYSGVKFEERQRTTRPERVKLSETLGLPKGSDEWFEIPVKKSSDIYQASELRAIKKLTLLHWIKKEGEKIPPEILHSVRGTIVYDMKSIIRKSIPYNDDIILDILETFELEGEQYVKIPSTETGSFNDVLVSNVKLFPHIEGTIIDIMKINGEIQWFTSHNLIPKGVKHKGIVLHQKARWAPHHVPFTDSLASIFEECDPDLLEGDVLFPKKCLFSNRLYRFVVVTRERVRAYAGYVGPTGFAVYIGCQEQWDNNNPPISPDLIGEPHTEEKIYKPKTVSSPPLNQDEPYIIEYKDSMTIEEANIILSGPHMVTDKRFTGGGKIIVQAKYSDYRGKSTKTFHVESTAYAHRRKITGDNFNLYGHFLSIMTLKNYVLSDEESLNSFCNIFPCLELPSDISGFTSDNLKCLVDNMSDKLHINVLPNSSDLIASSPIRHIWYNFLVCINVSQRPIVARYIERYVKDVMFLKSWLIKLDNKTKFLDLNGKDNINQKKFALSAWKSIKRHPLYNKDHGFERIMLLIGSKSGKLISLARKQSGTQRESIKLSEPGASFYERRTYAMICEGK
jgi:hypothetical protein